MEAPPVSLSPTAQNYYLDALQAYVIQLAAAATEYSPATASFLPRLALVALLGYFAFLLLVLFTHGNIPEVIAKGSMKGRSITPTYVFFICALAVAASAAALAPLEHLAASGRLAPWAARVLLPAFRLMLAFKLPSLGADPVRLAQCLVAVLAVHGVGFALYAALPASEVEGYVLDATGAVARYRLPGFSMLLAGVGAWALAVRAGALPAALLWDGAADVALCSFFAGVLLSAVFFFRGTRLQGWGNAGFDMRSRCPSRDMRHLVGRNPLPRAKREETLEFRERGPLEHFYCGLSEFNPVSHGVDWKMWLYATGALMLQLNIIGALVADARARGGAVSRGAATIASCLTFFVAEYMWQETVHLWTYDIFRERLGFKLIWGCLCWYPCFYVLPLAAVVGVAPERDASAAACAAGLALFFAGWALTRGANLQKFHCKMEGDKARPFLGFIPMDTVPGSDGRILCAGFWGIARHVNYLGEILQAAALALTAVLAGGSWLAFLYPLYYIALFVPRQADDDAVCEEKYGKKVWAAYVKRVPYRIVPGIF